MISGFWLLAGTFVPVKAGILALLCRAYSPHFGCVRTGTQADGLGWDNGAPLALGLAGLDVEPMGWDEDAPLALGIAWLDVEPMGWAGVMTRLWRLGLLSVDHAFGLRKMVGLRFGAEESHALGNQEVNSGRVGKGIS